MANAMKPTDILYDIADAIRDRGSLPATTLLPVGNFAPRIRAFTVGGANADAGRFFHFINFLTPAEEQTRNLVRCDGSPLYSTVQPSLYNALKGGWQSALLPISPSRAYTAFQLVGNKLYCGSGTSLTNILVINTLNGTISQIAGLPSRQYARLELVGTKIYCLSPPHPNSSGSNYNSIVCIDTADDSYTLIPITSAVWSEFLLIGNRLFVATRSSVFSLAYIDITTETVSYISGVTSTARGQHLIPAGTKIYVSSPTGSSQTDYLAVVDTTRIDAGTAVLSPIVGLPNRYHDASYLAGRFLYIGSSSSTTYTTIVRVDTQTDSADEVTVPQRKYSISLAATLGGQTLAFPGKLVGTKVYVGSATSANTIVVINNNDGRVAEITVPNRIYDFFDDAPASFINWTSGWRPESVGTVWQRKLYTSGTKLYLSSSTSANTLVVLNTNTSFTNTSATTGTVTDTYSEVTGLQSRTYPRFYVNGTTLYLLSSTAATTIEMVNTSTDTRITTPISPLTSRAYLVPIVVGDKLYVGNTAAATNVAIINLTNNTLIEDAVGLENRVNSALIFMHDKMYVGNPMDTGMTPTAYSTMFVMSDSVLPYHPQPVYIRPP